MSLLPVIGIIFGLRIVFLCDLEEEFLLFRLILPRLVNNKTDADIAFASTMPFSLVYVQYH